MLTIARHQYSIMVLFAVALHFVWAGLLIFDPNATNATAVNALHRYVPSSMFLALVVASAGMLAMVAMMTSSVWSLILLLPQQVLLMMSAAGCVEAIWTAQFADGVVRSRAFIAADQIYSIIAAVGHTLAIVLQARTRGM